MVHSKSPKAVRGRYTARRRDGSGRWYVWQSIRDTNNNDEKAACVSLVLSEIDSLLVAADCLEEHGLNDVAALLRLLRENRQPSRRHADNDLRISPDGSVAKRPLRQLKTS